MKVAICGLTEKEELGRILVKHGFQVVKKNPDFVLCYGGDGTILYSERVYPSVPKLLIKHNSRVFRRYDYQEKQLSGILDRMKEGNYILIEEIKLTAVYKNYNQLNALNEIQIHTALPIRATRFSVSTNEKKFDNLLGDGVIVSTPYGSTGYYFTTGGRPFKEGIGISFNNLFKEKIPASVVSDDSKIKIKIIRGPALLLSDNNPRYFKVEEGDEILVRKSEEKARFVLVER